jgi:hypothetical protein
MRGWILLGFIPSVGLAQDACPTDPLKTAPGLCGCDLVDSDWNGDLVVDSCIQPGATVHPSVVVGARARVDAGAVVDAGAALGSASRVMSGAT